MLVSACYITKNADTFLEYSMRSIKDYVDEIILVDDRSTDKTIEIAEKHNAIIKIGKYDGDKSKQRNEYLKIAKGKWIFVVDDDEVYKSNELRWLRQWMESPESEKYNTVRYEFLHFWKSSNYIIKGHMWNMKLERIFRRLDGLQYMIHHMVSDRCGRFLSSQYYNSSIYWTDKIKVYHYSYLKDKKDIRNKIRYYMLRDNPNCDKNNVEEWVDKHPYFSGNLNQPRYGKQGLYVAGNYAGQDEKVVKFNGFHPTVILKHPYIDKDYTKYAAEQIKGMGEYLKNANKYMEEHWRFHNHLDHERHQNRIKYTAEHCIGNVLEVGCANGFSTQTMQEHNSKCVFSGVEPTDWGYSEAVKNYPNLTFYKAIGELLPFEDLYFDTILLAEIIEHCDNPKLLVAEAWRVAKKRLIITTPTQKHDDPDHKRFYSISDMVQLLFRYGKANFSGLTGGGEKAKRIEDIYFQIAWVDK